MPSCKSVYDPQEDSTMLEAYVRQYAKGNVLDMGTGSGIQAIAASQNKNVKSVMATDIQKGVVEYCKKTIKSKKIRFMQSDLFNKIRGKFDTIIFNPPYLPQELRLKDLTVEGGKKGYEVIERFLNETGGFLEADGIVLLVFSSLTKKEKVEEFIKNNLFEFIELGKQHIFFEDIHVYLLRKSSFLAELEGKGISEIKYFAKGHRGMLFTGNYEKSKIAIKARNPKSEAVGRVENEWKWLEKLNKKGIGPKLLFAAENYFGYQFVHGDLIADSLKKSSKNAIIKILRDILKQSFILDSLKIDKEEMHHPFKHIIVKNSKPVLIDFERVHYSRNPKNVTQFCQFLMHSAIAGILKARKINIDRNELMKLAKIYKKNQSLTNFRRICNLI